MIKSINALISAVVVGLLIAIITTNFGSKIIGLIIFILIFIALMLHVFFHIRNRIKIKIIKQNFHVEPYYVKYEAINLGEKPNSFQERIYFKCLLPRIEKGQPKKPEPYKCKFVLEGIDRTLEPHKPKIFIAYTISHSPRLSFSWYRKYQFRPSRGMFTAVFVRNALDNGIPYWKYRIGHFLYRFFRYTRVTEEVIEE